MSYALGMVGLRVSSAGSAAPTLGTRHRQAAPESAADPGPGGRGAQRGQVEVHAARLACAHPGTVSWLLGRCELGAWCLCSLVKFYHFLLYSTPILEMEKQLLSCHDDFQDQVMAYIWQRDT